MSELADNYWKKCSTCKNPIKFKTPYFICSVSTCNGQRTGYVFCSVECFEGHLPGARHRDAGAVEQMSPQSSGSSPMPPEAARSPARLIVKSSGSPAASSKLLPQEVLVIASRLKEYITARSEFNTSSAVMDVLSDHLRILCDRAIDNARTEGRKTVLDRDFEFLRDLK